MIVDDLVNAARYERLGPEFARAFAFLRAVPADIADGAHPIDGDRIHANVMSYETKDPAGFVHEAHRRFADVQFMLRGEELMHFTPAGRLGAGTGYQPVKDYELFAATDGRSTLSLHAGQFAIFFPGEGHQPGCVSAMRGAVRKIVVKVAV